MSNMKNVGRFVEERNITPTLLKLETFINKVKTNISKGEINEAAGNNLINKTTYLLNMIRMPDHCVRQTPGAG